MTSTFTFILHLPRLSMPEAPEVRCFANKLHYETANTVLQEIVIHRGPYAGSHKPKYADFRNAVEEYLPHTIKSVEHRGKWMYFLLEGPQYYALSVHHGMEGSWCYESSNDHILLGFSFVPPEGETEKKSFQIYFQDSRRFGTFLLLDEEAFNKKLNALGPCVFTLENVSKVTEVLSTKRIQKHRLCEVLLDQRVFSGIGNYMRADIMYYCRLDPTTCIGDLTSADHEKLYKWITFVTWLSYGCKATTCGYYSSAIHYGSYEPIIYNRTECPEGYAVETFEDKNKRTVHWVPEIQTQK